MLADRGTRLLQRDTSDHRQHAARMREVPADVRFDVVAFHALQALHAAAYRMRQRTTEEAAPRPDVQPVHRIIEAAADFVAHHTPLLAETIVTDPAVLEMFG